MRRREFIGLVVGATSLPLTGRAQQGTPMRRIGVLTNRVSDDSEAQTRYAAFLQGLQEVGWVVGRNARIDVRWTGGEAWRPTPRP
jgi:DNA-binding LacI/PurR family transcriptional regulator